MPSPECQNFNNCDAVLCPMDEISINSGIWYPDEEICKRNDFRQLIWIRKQRAVQKLVAKGKATTDRYFTVNMLQIIKGVRRGIEGINPDQPLKDADRAERLWVEKRGGFPIAKPQKANHLSIAGEKNNSARPSKTTDHKSATPKTTIKNRPKNQNPRVSPKNPKNR